MRGRVCVTGGQREGGREGKRVGEGVCWREVEGRREEERQSTEFGRESEMAERERDYVG